MLGDLDDRVEDFSDLEDEFRLEAPVTEWVERDWAESRPWQHRSLSQHREEQLALLRLLRLLTSSFSKVSWKESSASSGVRDLSDLYAGAGERTESPPEERTPLLSSAQISWPPPLGVGLTISCRLLIVSFSSCLMSCLRALKSIGSSLTSLPRTFSILESEGMEAPEDRLSLLSSGELLTTDSCLQSLRSSVVVPLPTNDPDPRLLGVRDSVSELNSVSVVPDLWEWILAMTVVSLCLPVSLEGVLSRVLACRPYFLRPGACAEVSSITASCEERRDNCDEDLADSRLEHESRKF